MNDQYRLTMISSVARCNDNVVGLFDDRAMAYWVGDKIMIADKLNCVEYSHYEIDTISNNPST